MRDAVLSTFLWLPFHHEYVVPAYLLPRPVSLLCKARDCFSATALLNPYG